MMDMEAFRVDMGEAFRVDMGDACGGPTRMDVEDGDGDNGLSDGGDDCGGKAGDRNSPRDERDDGVGENADLEGSEDWDGDNSDSDSDNELDSAGYEGPCLPNRPARSFLPSQRQAMALLSMAVPPEDRSAFVDRFCSFKSGEAEPACPWTGMVCRTSATWIAGAYGCDIALPLRSAADMFPSSGMMSCFLNEIYVMDVILNRAPCSEEPALKSAKKAPTGDDDDVVLVRSYCEDDLHDDNDYKFRTMILFLPQCGVFYCARERRHEDVGVAGTLVALDMSWLRLQRRYNRAEERVSYTFGEGGYVKRFHLEKTDESLHSDDCYLKVSAWRLSLNRTTDSQQDRVVYRVRQCLDEKGPMMAPDVIDGVRCTLGEKHQAAEYNRRLATANSAKKDGRHYAQGCHHSRLSDGCWVIDPTEEHFVDIMVDLPQLGQQKNKQSVVMVRNVNCLTDDGGGSLRSAMSCITKHNKALRLAKRKGTARANTGDNGTMHALGTRVRFDGVTTEAYAANMSVGEALLRKMVVSLAQIGRCAFPQVHAVIRDTEENSGLQPVPPMDGEGGRRVGYTVDVSVDLGNTSHVDIHDGSQGYSLWGEEFRGRGTNWFLVLPNIYGRRPNPNPDGDAWIKFKGLAIRITDGVSVSWDGRDIRHCTSLSEPDGEVGGVACKPKRAEEKNHLYGTFTAAKERVVEGGRKRSAAMCLARAEQVQAVGDSVELSQSGKTSRNRRKKRKNKKRSQRGRRPQPGVVSAASLTTVPESCDYRIPKRARR
jgi:hypothetical protein